MLRSLTHERVRACRSASPECALELSFAKGS